MLLFPSMPQINTDMLFPQHSDNAGHAIPKTFKPGCFVFARIREPLLDRLAYEDRLCKVVQKTPGDAYYYIIDDAGTHRLLHGNYMATPAEYAARTLIQ